MTFARSVAAAILLFTAATGADAEITYQCELKAHTRFGFVPPVVLVIFDDAYRAALVYDGFIRDLHKRPIPARIEQIGAKKYALSWDLTGVKTKRERVKTRNILRLDIGRMRASFTGYVSGYFNTNRGSGRCVVLK